MTLIHGVYAKDSFLINAGQHFIHFFFIMKKPASSAQTDKKIKRTPAEKAQRKSEKTASQANADLSDGRAAKKANQKKSLRSAAKRLQKELDGRMSEVVARIRKETKAKLKEVVREATRRLDGDTERMFEQALHTIVRHYDSATQAADSEATGAVVAIPTTGRGRKRQKLNKDGSVRKPRTVRTGESATAEAPATAVIVDDAPKKRGSKPVTAPKPAAQRRGPKPGTPATGAKRGPKPRAELAVLAAPEAAGPLKSADSARTSEVSA